MSLRINTNVTALNALRNLDNTSQSVSTSIERLSSGLRINSGKDDPAGLIISEGLRAQIDGLNQAISNAQDADNLIKTGEGGLSEINSLLRSVRQLAVHAANTGVNDANAVQADQTQIASALQSIDRIATQTSFGTKKLLDGTSGISAAIVDTNDVSGVYVGGSFGGASTVAGNLNVHVTTSATRAQLVGVSTYAHVTDLLSTVDGGTTGAGGTVVLNGQSIAVSGSDTVQSLIDKINNVASVTGVSATFNTDHIELNQQNYGANFQIKFSESANLINDQTSATQSGINAVATATLGAATATFTGGQSTGDSGLRLTDADGNSLLLSEAGNSNLTTAANVAAVTAGALQFQVGANSGQTVNISLGNVRSSQLGTTAVGGTTLATIDVTTSQGAANALKVLDEAISQVSVLRAKLGAFQKNTLDSTVRSLGVGVENLSASESQIRDTNVAAEVVTLTKNQILSQAGTSVLAQANQAPNSVLSLLK